MNGIRIERRIRDIQFVMVQMFYLVFAVLLLRVEASPKSRDNEEISYMLPTSIVPEMYHLSIITNLADLNDNFTFLGRVYIQVRCEEDTDKIILHSKNLKIHESEVGIKLDDGEFKSIDPNQKYLEDNIHMCDKECQTENGGLKVLNHCYHDEYELYIIQLSETLKKGSRYIIHIPYDGELKPDLAGYYRSSYKDLKSGQTQWMSVTQFESTDARRAFPCFDEPIYKARFQVNLGRINTRSSISNMRQISSSPIQGMDNWVWDHYEVTVPMSTYLVAFVVSDFDFKISQKTENNVLFRVWARKDAVNQVDFAASVGPKVLEYYERYFDIKYPLPKQDMIAIPDFSSGAMENWGLITYREVALLYDPKVSTASSQVSIASVIAHELAHQWFGNLVTMKWWTDLWLNEGFATYVAAIGVHYLYPEWNSLNEEVVDTMANVFHLDSLKSSHPISVPIGHPKEIAEIFDPISYRKGAFVLRMMNLFLGEDTFREGVTNYLRKHAYGNAEQDYLWDSLTEAAHKNNALDKSLTVKEIMDTWTLQTGYPLITVTRNYKEGKAHILQEKYLVDSTARTDRDDVTWWVPLSYVFENDADFNQTRPKTWMSKEKSEMIIHGLPEDQWIIMNIQAAGVYRVKYDDYNWNRLIQTLKIDHTKIALINRVQLIEDSLALARSGDIDYSIVFNLLSYFKNEKEYLPWKSLTKGLSHLDKMLRFSVSYDLFRDFAKMLLEPLYNDLAHIELDDKPENLEKLKHKRLIVSWACLLEVGDCRNRAIKAFQQWMEEEDPDKNNPIPKESRRYIYCNAVKYGGEKEWNFLWNRYLNSNVGSEGNLILMSLGCTREVWLLNRYLDWSLTKVRRQDAFSVFAAIATGDIGNMLAKSFFQNRIADIYEAYGPKANKIGNYLNILGRQIISKGEFDNFVQFTKQNERYLHQAQKAVQQSLENAKVNVQWQNKFHNQVVLLLKETVRTANK